MPCEPESFRPLEDAISTSFIPSLLGRSVTPRERKLLALPARHGGLGITDPTANCKSDFSSSLALSGPLIDLIRGQENAFDPSSLKKSQQSIRKELKAKSNILDQTRLEEVLSGASDKLKLAIKCATEKGASSWVTARPLEDHQTVLHKGDFRDAIFLRYLWTPNGLPSLCSCGNHFSTEHSLS